jgi:uridine kinase
VYDEIYYSECDTKRDEKLMLICADKFYKDAQINNIPLENCKNLKNSCVEDYRQKYGDKKLNELMNQIK